MMVINGKTQIPEILDILDNSKSCFKETSTFPLPEPAVKSTFGILKNRPIICGGKFRNTEPKIRKECLTLDDDGNWSNKTMLIEARYGAASVVINNTLWVRSNQGSKVKIKDQGSKVKITGKGQN